MMNHLNAKVKMSTMNVNTGCLIYNKHENGGYTSYRNGHFIFLTWVTFSKEYVSTIISIRFIFKMTYNGSK